MHWHQVLIVLSDIFAFALVSCLKNKFLKQLSQANAITKVFGSQNRLENLVVSLVARRKSLLYPF